jgi:hypothetical protein
VNMLLIDVYLKLEIWCRGEHAGHSALRLARWYVNDPDGCTRYQVDASAIVMLCELFPIRI